MSAIIDIRGREILDSRGNPTGEVEVILLYTKEEAVQPASSVTEWPVLEGGTYRGGMMRREDLYGEHGR